MADQPAGWGVADPFPGCGAAVGSQLCQGGRLAYISALPAAHAVHTVRGRIAFVCTNAMWSNPHFEYSSWTTLPTFDISDPPRGPHTIWNHLGFFFKRSAEPRGSTSQDNNLDPGMSLPPVVRFTELVLPFWLVLLLLALPPFWNFVLPFLLAIHRPPGHCPKCGYDLRHARPMPGMRHSSTEERNGFKLKSDAGGFSGAAGYAADRSGALVLSSDRLLLAPLL